MSSFKESLNLPKTSFQMKTTPAAEQERIAKWRAERRYYALLEKGIAVYTLHDGPPFANGDIHLGHVLNKVLKDVDMRFQRANGRAVRYRPGWDCHGLPIENKVKKEGGIKFSPASSIRHNLKAACAIEADRWVNIQREQFMSLGILGEWYQPYRTDAPEHEESVIAVYEDLRAKGLIYKEKRPVHWSVENQTALALAELEYKTVKQNSWYVSFSLYGTPINEQLLIWTTTPWSLPGNVAVAVNPDINYVCVQHDGDSFYWIAEDCRERLFPGARVVDSAQGINLVGKRYSHPFSHLPCEVKAAGFVTSKTGTGLVHIAPAHGRDDYELALKENLEIYNPIGTNARFNESVPLEPLRGQKVWDGEKVIRSYLDNCIFREETIEHEYPHDWRSGKPTITIATEQVFVALDTPFGGGLSLRKRAVLALDDVTFFPPEGKQKLIKMLESRPDWCISRQREWGINIPGEQDIFDVWFESGSSWMHVDGRADTYFEGVDQYRGWFQHSLLLSVAVTDRAPFRRVVDHGFIVKPDGTKVSKSDPEYVPAKETIAKLGADPIRLWVCSNDFHKDISASPQMLTEFVDKYNKIRNTVRYLMSNLYDFDGKFVDAPADSLDGWVLQQTFLMLNEAQTGYENFEYHKVFREMFTFCTQTISAIYANAMKDRLYCHAADAEDRRRAQSTMMRIYEVLLRVLEPMTPMFVDEAKETLAPLSSKLEVRNGETWPTFLKLRSEALLQLDALKQTEGLNKATDAEVLWHFKEPEKFESYRNDLEDAVGCGFHQVYRGNEDSVSVRDNRKNWPACERCWKRRPKVQDGLCESCQSVMARHVKVEVTDGTNS